jgi:hypothetical protein
MFSTQFNNLLDACSGVVEEAEQRAIPNRVTSIRRQRSKESRELLFIEEVHFRRMCPFHRYQRNLLTGREHFRNAAGDIVKERTEHGQTLIPGASLIVTFLLQVQEKALRSIEGQVLQFQLSYPPALFFCDEA